MPKKYNYTRKTGRPHTPLKDRIKRFTLDFDKIKKLYLAGWTDEQVCDFIGISVKALHKWKKSDDFGSILKDWKKDADQRVERSLYERATGYEHKSEKIFQFNGQIIRAETIERYPPDPTSMIFWLKNRNPIAWRDKIDHEHSGDLKIIYGHRRNNDNALRGRLEPEPVSA